MTLGDLRRLLDLEFGFADDKPAQISGSVFHENEKIEKQNVQFGRHNECMRLCEDEQLHKLHEATAWKV